MKTEIPTIDPSNPYYRKLLSLRETHQLETHEAGGLTWRYLASGSGEAVLLLPGGLRRADSVFDSILDLEGSRRVVAVELPLAPGMAELLAGIRDILRRESIEKTAVIGRSFGGMVAQCFVRAYPELVTRLVLCHTTAPAGEQATKGVRQARRIFRLMPAGLAARIMIRQLETILTTGATEESAAFWRWYLAELGASGLGKQEVLNRLELGMDALERYPFSPDDLEDWPGRVLLVLAEDDPAVPPSSREQLVGTYPRAELKLFSDGGHSAAHRHPEEYRKTIEEFLSA
jgi:pimeloyl-ACP methyl ester carboxylesterase